MCTLNKKTKVEWIRLLLQRFHSIEAQNGTFDPDCRFPAGKRRFGNPSWGHLGVNTWANLSQLGAFWIVLNPLGWFWVRFGLVLVHLGSVLVQFGIRFRFVLGSFVSLSFRVDAASVSFSIPLSHPRQPSDTRNNRNTRTP